MTDILAQYDINTKDLKEAIAPVQPCVQTPSVIDCAAMRPFFAWMPVERIQKTFERTTQFMCMPASTYLRKCHCSTNPAANVYRCREADATNTIFPIHLQLMVERKLLNSLLDVILSWFPFIP